MLTVEQIKDDNLRRLREDLNDAVRLLTDLWQYDNLCKPVDGVIYSNGTHSEVKARVSDFLVKHAAKQS